MMSKEQNNFFRASGQFHPERKSKQ